MEKRILILINLLALFLSISAKFGILHDQYMGCFHDSKKKGRALSHSKWYNKDVVGSIESCVEYCRARGFSFAALQFQTTCYCGSTYFKYDESLNCYGFYPRKCSRDPGQICGGWMANSVYAVCRLGFFGDFCQNKCDYCNGHGCELNGDCLDYCPPGRKGHNCMETCPWGLYGIDCKYECSQGCLGGVCDPKIGVCTNGCRDLIFMGPYCISSKMNVRDVPRGPCIFCSQCENSKCVGEPNSGMIFSCPRIWRGTQCPGNCNTGYWGKQCDPCPSNCLDKTCNQQNGACLTGCAKGFYSEFCDKPCPSVCEQCDIVSGQCVNRCGNKCIDVLCKADGNCVTDQKDKIGLMLMLISSMDEQVKQCLYEKLKIIDIDNCDSGKIENEQIITSLGR